MATKALWTTGSPDTSQWERPDSAETQGSKAMCVLLMALQIGSAFPKRKLAACRQRSAAVCPFGLIDSTLGNAFWGDYTCSFPHASKKTPAKIFKTKTWNNLSLKGLGHLNTKGWDIRTGWWGTLMSVTCVWMCVQFPHLEHACCLSYEAASRVDTFRHRNALRINIAWYIGNTHSMLPFLFHPSDMVVKESAC